MSIYWLDAAAAPSEITITELPKHDPSLNGDGAPSLERPFRLREQDFARLFLSRYGIDYVARHFAARQLELRVVSHPRRTNTCFEKASLLGWDPLQIVKALYFERYSDGALFAVVVPETGCFMDRARLAQVLSVETSQLRKAATLPAHMEFGTCSPFIVESDLVGKGGRVAKILFDVETLLETRRDGSLGDFSFGLDHQLSVQLNYHACYEMLRARFPDAVAEEELLPLSFKEVVVRTEGRLKVSYDFKSLSYRIARFINANHGHGDVSITNDCVDELDIPDVLVTPSPRR